MKKLLCTVSILLGFNLAFAQSNSEVKGNLNIHSGGNITFFGNLNVTSAGLLRNQAGTLYTRGDVTGEQYIQLDATANLDINGGTFTLANESDEAFTALTIGTTGIVEVPATRSLTTAGTFTNNNSTDGIKLLADATGYGQLLTTGTVAAKGSMYAEQYLTSSANAGWRQMASPVATTLAEIDDDFQTFYQNTGNASQWSVWWYDASPLTSGGGTNLPATDNGAASAKYWTAAADNAQAFGPGNNSRAYNIYSGGAFDILNGGVLDVNGAFGDGMYSYDCYQTHDKGPMYISSTSSDPLKITGWNLIPNPYPSNIDVSTLLADNTNFDIAYKAVHVWDATTQQYIAITDGVAIDWNTTGGAVAATSNIAPFQAFWVKAYDDDLGGGGPGGSANATADHNIVLTNTHRTVQDNANFFKKAPPIIRLNVYNAANGFRDQAVLAFDDAHQMGLENNDAFKLTSSNEEVPSLFTFAEGYELSINRLPFPEPYHSVPMNMKAKTNGQRYYVEMVDEELDPGWTVILQDHKTGTLHNLRNGRYDFSYDQNFTATRFTVHINKAEKIIRESIDGNIAVYANLDGINVTFSNPKSQTASVVITNVAGQELFNGVVRSNQSFVYETREDVAVYVVRVICGSNAANQKVIK